MDEKTKKRLEEIADGSEELLPICCIKDCGIIRIKVEGKEVWIERKENSEIYDLVVGNYKELGKDNYTKGLSHTYCPVHFEEEMKKIEEH